MNVEYFPNPREELYNRYFHLLFVNLPKHHIRQHLKDNNIVSLFKSISDNQTLNKVAKTLYHHLRI